MKVEAEVTLTCSLYLEKVGHLWVRPKHRVNGQMLQIIWETNLCTSPAVVTANLVVTLVSSLNMCSCRNQEWSCCRTYHR
jgi:hypothetical protein